MWPDTAGGHIQQYRASVPTAIPNRAGVSRYELRSEVTDASEATTYRRTPKPPRSLATVKPRFDAARTREFAADRLRNSLPSAEPRRRDLEQDRLERVPLVSLAFPRRAAAVVLLLLLVPAVAAAQPAQNSSNRNRQPAGSPPAPPAAPAENVQGGDGPFKSFEEKLSYVLGVNAARKMQQDGINPDPQAFSRGFADTFTKKEPLLSDEEMTAVLQQFSRQLHEKYAAAQKELKDQWAAAFSDKNKPKGGPKATADGLKYEIYELGKGAKPKLNDTVVVHYVGMLPDGKKFDSSLDRGDPTVFPLQKGGLIEGWIEGLQLMPVGSKYKFYIPSKLAYGEKGRPPVIPPNQDLVFEIELLDILPAEGQGAPPAPPADAGDQPQK
jgi:FKBP-type peptidyl-prolyl cis-trans isomerase